MQFLVSGDEVGTTRDEVIKIPGEKRLNFLRLDQAALPRQIGTFLVVLACSVKLRLRKLPLHCRAMQRVEWMQVEDRLDSLAVIGQRVDLAALRLGQCPGTSNRNRPFRRRTSDAWEPRSIAPATRKLLRIFQKPSSVRRTVLLLNKGFHWWVRAGGSPGPLRLGRGRSVCDHLRRSEGYRAYRSGLQGR